MSYNQSTPEFNFDFSKLKEKKWLWIIIGIVILLFYFGNTIVNFLTDIQWFKAIGYIDVFFITFKAKILIWFLAFLIFLIMSFSNHFLVFRGFIKKSTLAPKGAKTLNIINFIISLLLPIIFASVFQKANWELYLQAVNSVNMGVLDPIFNKDIIYFLAQRPFMIKCLNTLIGYLVLLTISTFLLYFASGIIRENKKSYLHIGIMAALILIGFAGTYYFKAEDILFSSRGKVFGAGYTDVNISLKYYQVQMFVLVSAAIVTIYFAARKKLSIWLLSGVGLFIVAAIIGNLISAGVQNYVVAPNEIAKESEYIAYNIQYTRQAFGLDEISEVEFSNTGNLNENLDDTQNGVIHNIRITDYNASLQTYNQLQGIRVYYKFNDIDVDRYLIDGELNQVFLTARELNKNEIDYTYVNYYYKFTHGMGIAANEVNTVTASGQPEFILKDIPPQSNTDLVVTQPRIYYGELTNDSVMVGADIMEFDYPSGESNVETKYSGTGGIPLTGFNKFLYALKEGDIKILFSGYNTEDTKIMVTRNILERVQKIAPFLEYDSDPYIVVADDGTLKWFVDAYTISNQYPYSEPILYHNAEVNYIRNPIKIVIDAYNGTVDFYAIEPDEAFTQIYGSIYPDLFKSIDEMPEDLRRHIRYPEDLFTIQSQRYQKYHMGDIQVFYNQEDLWYIAKEKYFSDEQTVQPYHIIGTVEDEEELEFLMMVPYTPVNKNNAIAWMTARNDGEHYGELLIYKFPKDTLIYGPMQIEARIDQNPSISAELTLWGQQGSSVIRGNLLMVPVGDSILYVEPLYILSDAENALPEVKRIILSYHEDLVMAENLELALSMLFGDNYQTNQPDEPDTPSDVSTDNMSAEALSLIAQANEAFNSAQSYAAEGNWTEYGKEMDNLSNILSELDELTN